MQQMRSDWGDAGNARTGLGLVLAFGIVDPAARLVIVADHQSVVLRRRDDRHLVHRRGVFRLVDELHVRRRGTSHLVDLARPFVPDPGRVPVSAT